MAQATRSLITRIPAFPKTFVPRISQTIRFMYEGRAGSLDCPTKEISAFLRNVSKVEASFERLGLPLSTRLLIDGNDIWSSNHFQGRNSDGGLFKDIIHMSEQCWNSRRDEIVVFINGSYRETRLPYYQKTINEMFRSREIFAMPSYNCRLHLISRGLSKDAQTELADLDSEFPCISYQKINTIDELDTVFDDLCRKFIPVV